MCKDSNWMKTAENYALFPKCPWVCWEKLRDENQRLLQNELTGAEAGLIKVVAYEAMGSR